MQTGNLIHSAMMITWVLLDWSEKCAQHSIIGSGTGLQVLYEDCAMDELLKLVDMNHQLACDIDTGGCGRQNYIHHLLRAAPHVFTTVLGWQNGRESFEDISVTVDAIDVAMDIGVVYRGIDEGSRHQLISVVSPTVC
jgi:hypothetical protein